MEDIDLTLDRTFSDRRNSWWQDRNQFSLIAQPVRQSLGTIFQVFLEKNKRIKELRDVVEPWYREDDENDRGSFFGFRLRDPYASEGGACCDRCGKPLRPWDRFDIFSAWICLECNHDVTESVAEGNLKKSLFDPPSANWNMQL